MHAVFLLPFFPRCKDSPLASFRGCAFEKRTGHELWEVTKPISSFLCQIQAFLLTQQVKSHLFGTAPEVPDITASRKSASHPNHELSGRVSVTVSVLYYSSFPIFTDNVWMNTVWPLWSEQQPYSEKHRKLFWVVCTVLAARIWSPFTKYLAYTKVKEGLLSPKATRGITILIQRAGIQQFCNYKDFFFLLLTYWFIMWTQATVTLQPLLFIFLYSKHSSTSASWIADWSLSNLSTWTKVVWDPWTEPYLLLRALCTN